MNRITMGLVASLFASQVCLGSESTVNSGISNMNKGETTAIINKIERGLLEYNKNNPNSFNPVYVNGRSSRYFLSDNQPFYFSLIEKSEKTDLIGYGSFSDNDSSVFIMTSNKIVFIVPEKSEKPGSCMVSFSKGEVLNLPFNVILHKGMKSIPCSIAFDESKKEVEIAVQDMLK